MNRFLLYLIMLPSGLWQRLGADPVQLRAILNVKLMLDDRRPLNMGRPQKKKNQRFRIVLSMLTSCFTGFICALPLMVMDQLLAALWTYFSLFFLLLSITLITEFSTVLVDTKDKYILLPRPISDRTLFLSRSLHIFVYLFRVMLPMSLPGWITLALLSGWKAAILFPVPALALLFTALFVVLGAYLLILRLAPPNKFQEILSYFQIVFSIMIFGMGYLMPRATDSIRLQHMQAGSFSWAPFTPTYWFASSFSWLLPLEGGRALPLLGLLALIFPLFCAWLTLRFLAPHFTSVLSDLDYSGQDTPVPGTAVRSRSKSRNGQKLATLLNRRKEAQAGFLLAWIQTGRSRTFKMKVYPMFAYVPIYFLYMMLQDRKPLAQMWQELPGSGRHIFLLYMCSIVMLSTLGYLNVSEQYKAAWAYRATPIQEPGALMAGAFKVIWVKYFLPFFAVISAFVLSVWGLTAISDILLAMVNVTLFAACLGRLMYRRFPFSMFDPSMKSGSRFFKAMLGMSIPLFMGLMHYLALDMLWLKSLFLLLSLGMLYLVWDSYAHTPWSVIYQEEDGIKPVEEPERL